jgi:hypothetical protein
MSFPNDCNCRSTGCENCLAKARVEHFRHAWLKGYIRDKYEEKSSHTRRKLTLDMMQVDKSQKELFGDWSWDKASHRQELSSSPSIALEEPMNGLRMPETTLPILQFSPPAEIMDGWLVVGADTSWKTSCDGQASITPDSLAEQVSCNTTAKNSGIDLNEINDMLRNRRVS